jgi:pilus assembly protein TadC
VTVVLAALCAALSVTALLARPGSGRLQRVLPTERPGRGPGRVDPARSACAVAGLAVALLVAGPLGVAAGLVVALVGPVLLARAEPRALRDEREQLARDLPLLLDLLGACLAGGAPLGAAADAVAAAVPGPAGRRLAAVSAALAVGSPPASAWAALSGETEPGAVGRGEKAEPDDPYAAAARTLGRAAEGGAPVVGAVSRLASEARAQARAAGEQRARRVGVLVVAPLGLCFLPAFVLLGVVPVVAGLAGPLLASL